MNRRQLFRWMAAAGIGSGTLARALVTLAQDSRELTPEMIRQAEWIADLELTDDQRRQLLSASRRIAGDARRARGIEVDLSTAPAVEFRVMAPAPLPPAHAQSGVRAEVSPPHSPVRPPGDEDLAFLPVNRLALLLRDRQVSSRELTELYLRRLERFDPLLRCVVTMTAERAMDQAARADRELDAGHWRGPLHGIPWGAKDILSVPGYPTAWGVPQFRERVLDQRATVVRRLDEAGAVLVAKLAVGALAMGDRWFGGMTRSPWNPRTGSSGSSAGSASATVAGLVGFALGTETLGSLITPSRRCGTTTLRPTFGRISRYGCMPLCWTMDKIGPMARCVQDCALVLAAICGADGRDTSAEDWPFNWPWRGSLSSLRVGYVEPRGSGEDPPDRPPRPRPELELLGELGVKLTPVTLPSSVPLSALTTTINVEAAAVFDKMLRAGDTAGWNQWPTMLRSAYFLSAVDYVHAMRLRRKLMYEMDELFKTVDVLVNAGDLVHTNLTGHPSLVLPSGFTERDGVRAPQSTVFTGRLFDESRLLALAHAYEQALGVHLQRPPLEAFLNRPPQPGDDTDDGN